MHKVLLSFLVFSLVALSCSSTTPTVVLKETPASVVKGLLPTPHHAEHEILQGTFTDGPSVTRACLSCHAEVGAHLVITAHWTWRGPIPGVEERNNNESAGKINMINNFCIAVPGNEKRCAQCHIGYGWVDGSFDFKDPTQADCLVCHDRTGTYRKGKTSGGHPEKGVDLGAVARNVGKTSTASCGVCHFYGGGGDNIKLPNMGTSLLVGSPEVDVHMGREGFACTECHRAEGHRIAGSGVHLPVVERSLSCEGCHNAPVHDDEEIEGHTLHVACQTCHIPQLARSQPTKSDWRWSQAGDSGRDTEPDKFGKATYLKKKGAFQWKQGYRPTLAWYDGRSQRMLLGEIFDPASKPISLAAPVATIKDMKARIYPFKVMRGDQPADAVRHVLLPPHLFGEAAGPKPYWKEFDWAAALQEGAAAAGLAYSGEYEFVSTAMYMSANHGVAPADQALSCDSCHDGGIDFKALGYTGDPIEDGGRAQLVKSKR
jgi:octaheme c-type cytochrome (tetrathionate reductase family)